MFDPAAAAAAAAGNRFSHVWLSATPQTEAYQGIPPGILQARTLEWVAIFFSNAWKWKWSRSVVPDSVTPWTAAYQAPPSMGFSRQEYWSGVPLPSPVITLEYWKHVLLDQMITILQKMYTLGSYRCTCEHWIYNLVYYQSIYPVLLINWFIY